MGLRWRRGWGWDQDKNHPLPGVGGRKRDPEGVRSHPGQGRQRKQFRSWRERRNPRGVCGQGKESWEPLILESGDSLPVTTSSFSRWDWCGQRGPRTYPGPGKVEGGRVETGLSPDPDRRQEGGSGKGVKMGCRVWPAQTPGTDKPERLLPSQLIQVQITDGGSDSTCPAHPTSLPLSEPVLPPARPLLTYSKRFILPASNHPQSVPPALLALRCSSPNLQCYQAHCYQGYILVAKGAFQAPINVLSPHKGHREAP